MLDPDPFSPLLYWPHVVLGISSVLFAALALGVTKGSQLHRAAGWAFVATMGVAAITAVGFSFVQLAPPALFSSAVVLYGVGMAALTLRACRGILRGLELCLPAFPAFIALVALAAAAFALLPPPEGPDLPGLRILVAVLALLVGVLFAAFAFGDIKFLRDSGPGRPRRYRRHALRMALAVTETVRAPLISFGPPLGTEGMFSFPIYFFGPFLLIPILYFLALPAWLRTRGSPSQV